MTYSQPQTPWRMAHRIECHLDHEIVIASALPNPIPEDATVSRLLMVRESYVKS
jgi:hypothetical protein